MPFLKIHFVWRDIMTILEEVLESNDHFVKHLPEVYCAIKQHEDKLPNRHLAIVTCMDTRLVDFLEPALGIRRGEAKIIKNAGNTVTGPFEATIRSLMVGVFELGVKEIMVIGHHDCGIANTTSHSLIEKMLNRGISKDAIQMIQEELERWLDNFKYPIENVKQVVEKIRTNPLIPNDVPVHGLMFYTHSGKIDIVIDGYK
mgnify:CR=1 FL=1